MSSTDNKDTLINLCSNSTTNDMETSITAKIKHPVPSHIFFAGAAWGCGFYVGVYKALQEKYGLHGLSNCKWAGNSSGCLLALCGAAGLDWKIAEKLYLKCITQIIQHGAFQKMSISHNLALDEIFNTDNDLYKKLNNKIFIGVTHFIDEYDLISKWNNNDEVRDCAHASLHIPYYCTHINKIKINGTYKRGMDGSFASMFHRFNKNTLVVTAMSHKGDVHPIPPLPFLYKPHLDKYYKMRDDGYIMMNKWNGKYKWDEYNIYTKSKYRLKNNINKRLISINTKKIILFLFWMLRILEEIKVKRIIFAIGLIILYRKYGKKMLQK